MDGRVCDGKEKMEGKGKREGADPREIKTVGISQQHMII